MKSKTKFLIFFKIILQFVKTMFAYFSIVSKMSNCKVHSHA